MQMSAHHNYTITLSYQELKLVCKALSSVLSERDKAPAATLSIDILKEHVRINNQHKDTVDVALRRAEELIEKDIGKFCG
tara:strand:+ start:1877 stop:2116 length:240 start_codon:yes stop_codon:yes gene_type:complete